MGSCPFLVKVIGKAWTSNRVQMRDLLGDSQVPGGKKAPQTAGYTTRAVTRVGRTPCSLLPPVDGTSDFCVLATFNVTARLFSPAVHRCGGCHLIEKLATENIHILSVPGCAAGLAPVWLSGDHRLSLEASIGLQKWPSQQPCPCPPVPGPKSLEKA